jgi:hypothetical protein
LLRCIKDWSKIRANRHGYIKKDDTNESKIKKEKAGGKKKKEKPVLRIDLG